LLKELPTRNLVRMNLESAPTAQEVGRNHSVRSSNEWIAIAVSSS